MTTTNSTRHPACTQAQLDPLIQEFEAEARKIGWLHEGLTPSDRILQTPTDAILIAPSPASETLAPPDTDR